MPNKPSVYKQYNDLIIRMLRSGEDIKEILEVIQLKNPDGGYNYKAFYSYVSRNALFNEVRMIHNPPRSIAKVSIEAMANGHKPQNNGNRRNNFDSTISYDKEDIRYILGPMIDKYPEWEQDLEDPYSIGFQKFLEMARARIIVRDPMSSGYDLRQAQMLYDNAVIFLKEHHRDEQEGTNNIALLANNDNDEAQIAFDFFEKVQDAHSKKQ